MSIARKKPDIETVLVSPAMASDWLESTKFHNRNVSERMVDKIARDIKNGKWRFDGSTLKFDTEGNLVDGQHRLWGVIRAQHSVLCLIVRNLEPQAINIIDTNKARSNSDILHFNGFGQSNSLANACRISIGFRRHESDLGKWASQGSKHVRSSSEIIEEAQNNKPLVDSVQIVASTKFTRKFMGLGTAAFCHHLFAKKDKLAADEFFYLLEKGVGLPEGHAVLALRNCLTLRDHVIGKTPKGANYRYAYTVAFAIKAWNFYREARTIKRLSYFADREKYPVVA